MAQGTQWTRNSNDYPAFRVMCCCYVSTCQFHLVYSFVWLAYIMSSHAHAQNDMSTAREVLARILLFGIVPGGVLAALFMAGQTLLPAAFTTDAAVIGAVANVVPLLAICMVRNDLAMSVFGLHLIRCASK